MLPVDTEARAMCVPLPDDRVGELELPGKIESRRRASNKQTRLGDIDQRRAETKTSGTVLLAGGCLFGAGKEVGKTEIVDQRRAEHARETEQALVGPSERAAPVRGIGVRSVGDGRRDAPAAIVRVTDESRVRRSEERRVGKECRSRWS